MSKNSPACAKQIQGVENELTLIGASQLQFYVYMLFEMIMSLFQGFSKFQIISEFVII